MEPDQQAESNHTSVPFTMVITLFIGQSANYLEFHTTESLGTNNIHITNKQKDKEKDGGGGKKKEELICSLLQNSNRQRLHI